MNQQFVFPKGLSRESAIKRVATLLENLPMDKAWRVEICEHVQIRTNQQNRYLWGVCYETLCKVLPGWEANDVHEYMLGECFGWETVAGWGRKRMRPLKRSSRLDKFEFVEFVGFIQRTAAEHGVFIPDPDPEYWLHESAA